MKDRTSKTLRKELIKAGASSVEIGSLTSLASDLRRLNVSSEQPAKPSLRLRTLLPLGITSIAGLAVGMFLVIYSQTVLPSSWLFPVQKMSDSLAVYVDPGYRGTVMMKRAQEVKQLVNNHAATNLVLATLAQYQGEASVYKANPSNYVVFDYCKNNLQQATQNASSTERQAIDNTLATLKNA